MKKTKLLKTIPLANTKEGIITISHIDEPYGEGSKPVVSIGISLDGDENNPDWKAHIPYENIDDVIEALKEAKEKFNF
ncbi:hypothetical protein FE773_01110 [Caminibacter mediatlanticus TB-2]|uniref:Uncharacterized protein n=1 Tax=Caminibacter mediatlanticus TB-2 TaxID=391592 RepID=A0ABX5V6F0_9BACT|nr:hypothetical protein [Caminibacter mediatlanticus]QCT93826.1 hypothetical protein FE773_01110 [Caminibacter mediatlanticus TB-2]